MRVIFERGVPASKQLDGWENGTSRNAAAAPMRTRSRRTCWLRIRWMHKVKTP